MGSKHSSPTVGPIVGPTVGPIMTPGTVEVGMIHTPNPGAHIGAIATPNPGMNIGAIATPNPGMKIGAIKTPHTQTGIRWPKVGLNNVACPVSHTGHVVLPEGCKPHKVHIKTGNIDTSAMGTKIGMIKTPGEAVGMIATPNPGMNIGAIATPNPVIEVLATSSRARGTYLA